MNNCVFCSRTVRRKISLSLIFSFKKTTDSLICTKCFSKFTPLNQETTCLGCTRIQKVNKFCAECEKWQEEYPALIPNHRALYDYNEIAREYMELYKFKGDILLADLFSEELRNYLKPFLHAYTLVPVPISPHSREVRGFNQVEIILERAQVPYRKILNNKTTEIKQTSKNKKMRMKTRQPFYIDHKELEKNEVKNKLLIIDDVYTTGRTIYHARDALSNSFETFSLSLFR